MPRAFCIFFQDLKVNLIITDYSMPGMTGYELLKKIKGSKGFQEVPVVVMSSERIIAIINRCLEEGVEEFLSKPVKLSDIERLMSFLTRGETQVVSESRKRKLKNDGCEELSSLSPSLSSAPLGPFSPPTKELKHGS